MCEYIKKKILIFVFIAGGPVSPRLAVHTVHTVHNEPDLHSIPPSFTVIN